MTYSIRNYLVKVLALTFVVLFLFACQQKADLILIDTAGRLQNRTELMEELAKIVRVIKKHLNYPENSLEKDVENQKVSQ